MYPAVHSAAHPDKPAVVVADTGQALSYADLETRSTRLANVLRHRGLDRGDVVALLSTNSTEFFEVYWACLRSGLYLTPINTHLSAGEVAYIVDDCDATVLIASGDLADLADATRRACAGVSQALSYRGAVAGFEDYETCLAAASDVPPERQPRGADMLYSSGTTGRPKGVKPTLPDREVGDAGDPYVAVFGGSYAMGPDTVYFSPAPLYHAAPLRFGMITHSLGGTVITTTRFDAEQSLAVIAEYGVTHSQWVPTHFVRMLRLPAEVRAAYDVGTLTHVVHAAAPCPPDVKRAMISWFGPILHEYYSSTEANGVTMVSTAEWIERPGTVGSAKLGVIRICDDSGAELPVGESGTVYFEREARPFSYHKSPEKTETATHPEHPTWTTCGDIGFVDAQGYLYLNDRKAFTIISGGVNIYPQEIENCLALHPLVADVAVIGVPDDEFGESVLAIVDPASTIADETAAADELKDFVRRHVAGYKVPRTVVFDSAIPRTPTGKLVKGVLRDRYVRAPM